MLEVCCGSYLDAINAYKGNAKRIELNQALYLGGLTASLSTLRLIKENLELEVLCMVRPRGCGFKYLKEEIDEIFLSAKLLLEHGADGIVFGFLTEDFRVDEVNTKKMIDLVHSYNKKAIFHRAIDLSSDYIADGLLLKNLGIDNILTSGTFDKAIDGVKLIKELNDLIKDKVNLVVGSGINESNAKYILDSTGVKDLHGSCKDYLYDNTTSNNNVSYRYLEDDRYESNSIEKIKKLVEIIGE